MADDKTITDYVVEDREDLVARCEAAQRFARFLMEAYDARQAYGVDFKTLEEWADRSPLEDARKLRPHAAQMKIAAYFEGLTSSLRAAVQRKKLTLVRGGKSDRTQLPKKEK